MSVAIGNPGLPGPAGPAGSGLPATISPPYTASKIIKINPAGGNVLNGPYVLGESANAAVNAGGVPPDEVMVLGYNVAGGGGVGDVAAESAMYLQWEGHYEPVAGTKYSEFHLIHYRPSGVQQRPMSFRLAKHINEALLMFETDQVDFFDSTPTRRQYARLSSGAFNLYLSSSVNAVVNMDDDGTKFRIINGGAATRRLEFASWNKIRHQLPTGSTGLAYDMLDDVGTALIEISGNIAGSDAGRFIAHKGLYADGGWTAGGYTARFDAGAVGIIPLILRRFSAGQTADIQRVEEVNGTSIFSRFNKAGYFMTRKVAAPADADLVASELSFWLDDTNGACKAMFKAKQADGTVRSGSVALA
jgi:hypothetical protein